MEIKEIKVNDQKVKYLLKRSSKARNLRLLIDRSGSLIAVLPARVSEKFAEKFIIEKIDWIAKNMAKMKDHQPSLLQSGSYKEFILNKSKALHLVKSRILIYNHIHSFRYKKVSIRDQKSRWGSCSRSGNLNFNYRIVFLPIELVDYLVVHELCHLKEFNHSARFWQLVSMAIPKYGECRSDLKKV